MSRSGAQYGVELGYAQITANVTETAGPTDVAGLSTTVTVGSRPIVVEVFVANMVSSASGVGWLLLLLEDGVVVSECFGLTSVPSGAPQPSGAVAKARRNPSAGSHTYKLQLQRWATAGTVTLNAATSNPAYIQVVQV